MNLNISTPEQIKGELEQIDAFLNITCSEQVEEVVERGSTLAVYIARSGKLLADAKHHLDERMKSEVFETLKTTARKAGATSKAVNAIIDSLCRDEQYMVTWCDRVNRAATHQLDWCRTLIAKAREEMRITNYSNNIKY
jgi:small nuclear ribonucleoprotein (snRNP)-like protein